MTSRQEGSVVALAGSRDRFDNIDALRSLAVIAVLLFHYTARFPLDYVFFAHPVLRASSGFMGVELFFIISGYCIYMTAAHCPSVELFWARRISRLQPAYMAAILVTFAVVSVFGLPGREVTGFQALRNMLWLNGVHLAPDVDGAYWSLIAEMKFYLLFGMLFFGLKSCGDPVLWWALLCGVGALVASIDTRMLGGAIDFRTLSFGTFIFPYSSFFLVGMLIYSWDATPNWTRLLAIAVFAWACWSIGEDWTQKLTLVALFPLAKVVLDWRSFSVPAPIVFVGFVSYPLYLIHQNVGVVVLRQMAPYIPWEYGRIALAIAVSLLLAALISVAVEHRFRKALERPLEHLIAAILALPVRLGLLRPASLHAVPEQSHSRSDTI